MKILKSYTFMFLFLSFFFLPSLAGATVIVAIVNPDGDIVMGADSCAVMLPSFDKYRIDEKKIVFKNNILIGFSGDIRALNVIKYLFVAPDHPDGMSNEAYMNIILPTALQVTLIQNELPNSDYLLLAGYKGKLYQIGSNGCVFGLAGNFHAVGSGYAFALGSLNSTKDKKTKERLILALKSAADQNATVCAPWHIVHLPK